MAKKFYITTAIDYVNNLPHLGTAYEKICADVIARYHRLLGDEVFFMMGNDEHSHNVFRQARELGLDPLVYCDQMEVKFKEVWQSLNLSYDDFIRTTQPRHAQAVLEIFRRLEGKGTIPDENEFPIRRSPSPQPSPQKGEGGNQKPNASGYITRGPYRGLYCTSCEAYVKESDLLENLYCPTHPTVKAVLLEEENYFFKLSTFQEALRRHLTEHPDFIRPEVRRHEMLSLLEQGLDDISISRRGFEFGIPTPGDPGQTIYVWIDALINYLTAIGFPHDEGLWKKWWPADVHVIGKDITRFHTLIWPAMLLGAGLPLPKQVLVHGFVYFKGSKMSKTAGTTISPTELAHEYGADALRYYLVREIRFGQDGDFSLEQFEQCYHADLANDYGNLIHRVLSMSHRYMGGTLRRLAFSKSLESQDLIQKIRRWKEEAEPKIRSLDITQVVGELLDLVRATNTYLERRAPWTQWKEKKREDVEHTLYTALYALAFVTFWLSPVIPTTAGKVWSFLGWPPLEVPSQEFYTDWAFSADISHFPASVTLQVPQVLFPKKEP